MAKTHVRNHTTVVVQRLEEVDKENLYWDNDGALVLDFGNHVITIVFDDNADVSHDDLRQEFLDTIAEVRR